MERNKRIEMNPVDDAACVDIDGLIKYWNDALPPMVDYADMVGAPEWAYGCRYVYEDPCGYFIEDTIVALNELKELKELVKGVTVQLEENNKKLANMIHLNKTMIINEPYHMEIHSEKDAQYAIKNMCSNCYRLHYCTGAEAYKCNQVKEEIRQHFMENGVN